ncbi:HTH-type transcriptional repressor [Arthrobacter sp. SO5]|uniref:TetR family transcriptional regulator n=1 Tax=Arthrobacter sp. SO5 TaxID=1897055 RepID=UPI001E4295B5|nr:TetR family transcriptional regulator [Arthrobacter sp. SO5]MCB5273493.1 HTH-type transcriptional repressor [Arthrobacter sp. SO5]
MSSMIYESDLSARGRIVAAALGLFAAGGFRATTVRAIAAEAGVSAGLVVHHFGSKEGLRRECDERVLRFIVEKGESDAPAEVLAGAANPFGPYLARMLYETGSSTDALFDALLATARDAVELGIKSGTMRKSDDVDAQAAALVTLGVAPFFLAHQLARWAGGDALGGISRIAEPIADIYARGLLLGQSRGGAGQ